MPLSAHLLDHVVAKLHGGHLDAQRHCTGHGRHVPDDERANTTFLLHPDGNLFYSRSWHPTQIPMRLRWGGEIKGKEGNRVERRVRKVTMLAKSVASETFEEGGADRGLNVESSDGEREKDKNL